MSEALRRPHMKSRSRPTPLPLVDALPELMTPGGKYSCASSGNGQEFRSRWWPSTCCRLRPASPQAPETASIAASAAAC
jgi:hypothetical protein